MSALARLGARILLPGVTADVDDGAVLAAGRGIIDGTLRADVALMDGPHILVCTDSVTGTTTYTGPFPTGYDALAELEEHESGQQTQPGVRTVVCSLAPLLPG